MNIDLYELIFPLSIPSMWILIRRDGYLSQERFRRKAQGRGCQVQTFFSSFYYIFRLLEAMARYLELIDVFLERKTFGLRSENFERLEPQFGQPCLNLFGKTSA